MKKMLFSLKGILAAVAGMLVVIAGLIGSYQSAPPADISFGAIPGSEVNSPTFTVNGVPHRYYHAAMMSTSTNVCTFLSPSATTTLVSARARFTMSDSDKKGSTMTDLIFTRASDNWASTTKITGVAFTAGNNAELVATTTSHTPSGTALLTDNIVKPNSYLKFAVIGTSTTGVYNIKGLCDVVLGEF